MLNIFKDLFNFKNKPVVEVGIKMFVIASMVFVTYHMTKVVYDNVVEGFEPHIQSDKIGECDAGTKNAGSKWWNYLKKQ